MPKKCFMPKCSNTSENSNKIFLTMPYNDEVRKSWCKAVNRRKTPKANSGSIFCCEDHFELENDCKNWIHYKLMRRKIFLKKGIVPHKNLNGEDVSREFSQLNDSAVRESENVQPVSRKTSETVLFEELSASAQISCPESSPKQSQLQESTLPDTVLFVKGPRTSYTEDVSETFVSSKEMHSVGIQTDILPNEHKSTQIGTNNEDKVESQ